MISCAEIKKDNKPINLKPFVKPNQYNDEHVKGMTSFINEKILLA